MLGKKIEMSQIFNEKGDVIPVTIVSAGPLTIVSLKTKEKDGYLALQVGFDKKKELNKPQRNQFSNLGNFRWTKEFKLNSDKDLSNYQVGQKINLDIFSENDKVIISGISVGKGFQGVVKRHGFHGGPASHGQKDRLRAPGSIGSTNMQRVMKGKKMAGRTGGERISLKNRKIVKIDAEKGLLFIKGALPGKRNSLLEIRN